MTRPRPRNQRSRKLAAGDETDHERPEAQSVMDVKRKNRHSDADDEEGNEDHSHDR